MYVSYGLSDGIAATSSLDKVQSYRRVTDFKHRKHLRSPLAGPLQCCKNELLQHAAG